MNKEIIDAFDKGKTLVFPSEVAAASNVAGYVRATGKALFADSALSWDTFKDSLTEFPKTGEPAGIADRALFTEEFFRKHHSKLRYYGNNRFSESYGRFKASIIKSLPGLKDAVDNSDSLPADMLSDINLILKEWTEYIDLNGLYEKKYFKPDFSKANTENTIIVMPGCITDSSVEEALKYVESIDFDENSSQLPSVNVYENTYCEIKNTMRNIYALLKDGVRASDIAITVTDFDRVFPYIEEEAYKRNILIDSKNGMKLVDYSAGTLFSQFVTLYRRNFDFDSLRTFLLNPCFPFKDIDKNREIVKTLAERNAYGGLEEHCRKLDDSSILKTVASFVRGAVNAKTCEEIRFNINQFQNYYFKDGSFSSTGNPLDLDVFKKCMDNLDELEKTIDGSGGHSFENGALFDLFYRILSLTDYTSNSKKPGIKVYSYPISCALNIPYHFVTGLDDESTGVKRRKLGFLTKTEELEAGLEGEDISASLIKSFLLSENVNFSCSKETFSGSATVASVFEEVNATKKPEIIEDSFNEEEKTWNAPEESTFAPGEKQSSFFIEKTLRDSVDLRKNNKMPQPELPVKISASAISAYDTCPYKWMCRYIEGLEESCIDPKDVDNMEIGEILHETYEIFFRKNRDCGKYKEQSAEMAEVLAFVIKKYSAKPEANDALHYYRIYSNYSKKLGKIGISGDRAKFSIEHYCVKDMERSFEFSGDNFTCKGRIDCILEDENGGFAVIDFKKGSVDKDSAQIFIYSIAMKNDSSFKVQPLTGAFYSIEEGKFAKTWTEEEFAVMTSQTEEKIKEVAEKIMKGSYEKTPSDSNCSNCPYTRICRSRYVIK